LKTRASLLCSLVVALAAGCPAPTSDGPAGDERDPLEDLGAGEGEGEGPGAPALDGGPTHPTGLDGAALYAQLCSNCHGADADGASAPALRGYAAGREQLVMTIDVTMPAGDTEACTGDCAEAIADYVLTLPALPAPPSCDERVFPERRLRLLTRDELNRTLRAAFAEVEPSCSDDDACAVDESCVSGSCRADSCELQTFRYDPAGAQLASVHVAGSFNAWSAEDAEWAMSWRPAQGVWALKRPLPDGDHTYKLVLDGQTWIEDPAAELSQPNEYGGSNSLRRVACANAAPPASLADDWAAALPVETRPPGYAFDNHADALVTSVHLDELMRAAGRLATYVTERPERLLPCTPRPVGDRLRPLLSAHGRAPRRCPARRR
jgi:hypothetical protein